MANTRLFLGSTDSANLFRIGQVGIDTGNQDSAADPYTIAISTERQYPAGRNSLVNWRRVAVRLLRTAPVDITIRVYVDEVQTQTFDTSGDPVDQEIEFNLTGGGECEEVIEADIQANGTSIRIELDILSTDIDGLLLLEPFEAHGRPIRESLSRTAETS